MSRREFWRDGAGRGHRDGVGDGFCLHRGVSNYVRVEVTMKRAICSMKGFRDCGIMQPNNNARV